MDIIVLAGGISTERDVSLSSGALVCRALREAGHRAAMVDLFLGSQSADLNELYLHAPKEYPVAIKNEAPDIIGIRQSRGDSPMGDIGPNVLTLCRQADVVYLGLHGEDGENGRLQAVLDMVGVTYTGTGYLGSALAMNKGLSKQMLMAKGLPTPPGRAFNRYDYKQGLHEVELPCVVKPCCGGSSIGVSIVHDEQALLSALKHAFDYEDEVVVESYIQGREFSVGILNGVALPVIEIIPREGFYDYANKYQPGATKEICPAKLGEQTARAMQQTAQEVFDTLRLEVYARIDFMLDAHGRHYCLEANTLPGMTPTSLLPQEAAQVGLSYVALCEKIVESSLNKG
jgi:D-alanine-D-alanine ligase